MAKPLIHLWSWFSRKWSSDSCHRHNRRSRSRVESIIIQAILRLITEAKPSTASTCPSMLVDPNTMLLSNVVTGFQWWPGHWATCGIDSAGSEAVFLATGAIAEEGPGLNLSLFKAILMLITEAQPSTASTFPTMLVDPNTMLLCNVVTGFQWWPSHWATCGIDSAGTEAVFLATGKMAEAGPGWNLSLFKAF